MKTNLKLLIFIFVFGLALAFGINVAFAATTQDLQPAATIVYNEPVKVNSSLVVNGVAYFPLGVHIGQQGTGGVTFFNGTIVNQTTTKKGADNPVTFGDNVRIDGVLFRGAVQGPGDGKPLKVMDDMYIAGALTGGGSVVVNDDLKVSGNVGIGTRNPRAKLEVAGQIMIRGGKPGAGKVLTSDASGLATWETPVAGLPSGTAGQTLRHDGANWIVNNLLFNDGTNIGIGTTTPRAKLEVAGGVRITGGAVNCSATNRGELKFTAGGAGADDKLQICMKNASDNYVWVLVARGGN